MIIGVGLDVVDLDAFRAQLADPASAFVGGTFTAGEQADARARASGDPSRHLAARYAAKEAFLKAWSGPRFGAPPVVRRLDLLEIEVISDVWGRPALRVGGVAAADLDALGPWRAHLSLTHDGPVAVACVVLESI